VREAQNRWWRNDPPFKSNSASGQSGEFNARKHRGQMQASFIAQCNKDKRDWAAGLAVQGAYGKKTTIRHAYNEAMQAKRARLEQHERMVRDVAWFEAAKPVKPRYVLRNGALVLAEAA
jgi:hypothetical protein